MKCWPRWPDRRLLRDAYERLAKGDLSRFDADRVEVDTGIC